jgi:hypothetical protein
MILLSRPWASRLLTSFPELRFLRGRNLAARRKLVLERTCHANWYRKMLQRPKGLRVHPAGLRRSGHIRSYERAGLPGLAEGQKLNYEIVIDNRSGKSAADQLQIAA